MKKIVILVILVLSLALASCDADSPDIFELIDMLLDNRQDGSVYSFDAEFNISINKAYLVEIGILEYSEDPEFDAMPDEINISLNGELYHVRGRQTCNALINLSIQDSALRIFVTDDTLYFENNEVTRIILDLLTATGFVDLPVSRIFSEFFYAAPRLISVDLQDFDLSRFERYTEQIERTFTISSAFSASERTAPTPVRVPAAPEILPFADVRAQMERELLKIPGYRFQELHVVLCPNENTINILATRENGGATLLEPVRSDIGVAAAVAKFRHNPAALWSENILPMRYILELMGYDVGWERGRSFITRGGERVYFQGPVVNSRVHINLMQLLVPGRFLIIGEEADQYIEFIMIRR